jgi:hypothetical protein
MNENKQSQREITWSNDDVRRGRELVAEESSSRWDLGDLALKVAPMGAHGGKRDGDDTAKATLNRFATEIGIAYETLDAYRQVADNWSSGRRVDLPWSVHRAFASLEDREAVIRSRERWTAREAGEFVRSRRGEESDEWESFGAASLRDELPNECPCCWRDVA